MPTIRVLVIFGTRPEAIKMAPVIRHLQATPDLFEVVVCVTAQHRHMLDQMLSVFDITPDVDLNVMEDNQSLASLTAKALTRVTDTLDVVHPDIVLVQGDTTTAMAAALASFYRRIPVGHVEAGLRTSNRLDPFPEEINRRIISTLASYHFAPTPASVRALLAEGHPEDAVQLTGNTIVDAVHFILKRGTPSALPISCDGNRLILVTAHRRENFGEPIRNICSALQEILRRYPGVEIVYPVHPNPNVREPVYRMLSGTPRIHLIAPLQYDEFLSLMARAHFIMTDSGGIQEEAPTLGKPVLVLRRCTERPEAIEAGTARLVGTTVDGILAHAGRLLTDQSEYDRMASISSPFGDGKAAERIVRILASTLSKN